MNMNNRFLLLSIGGIAGTILRYLVATWVPDFAGTGFPYGTLAVNLSACLIMGWRSARSIWIWGYRRRRGCF